MTAEDASGAALPKPRASLGPILEELYRVLEKRKRVLPEDSYTAKLLAGPKDKLLKKVGEEASETIIAAMEGDLGQLRYEIGDLLYHLLVVMVREGVTLDDLAGELARRRGE